MPTPTYLDCDTGVDDTVALAYLLAAPTIDLVGIGTVSGNIDSTTAARNTLDLLALAGAGHIPVAIGAHDHLDHPYGGGAAHVHGANGIGDIVLPTADAEPDARSAAQLLIDLSHQHPGTLHIVAIGPLTNLALALELDPTLPDRISAVTVMGGAALAPGNITPAAEANIYNDPQAAAALLAADWDVTLVPLDATMEHTLEETDRVKLLLDARPFVQAVGQILDLYFDFYVGTYGRRACALHDPLAAVIAAGGAEPSRALQVPVVVDVTQGPGRGQTIADLRGQRIAPRHHDGVRTRLVLDVDAPIGAHLVSTILGE